MAAAALLTQVEFPARYFDLVDGDRFAVAVVTLRNLVLIAVLGLTLRALQLGRQQELLDRDGEAAFNHGSSSEVSKRTCVSVRKRSTACSRLTPITPPRGPVMPTSVT